MSTIQPMCLASEMPSRVCQAWLGFWRVKNARTYISGTNGQAIDLCSSETARLHPKENCRPPPCSPFSARPLSARKEDERFMIHGRNPKFSHYAFTFGPIMRD